jgi:hypothetical protein
MKYPIKFEVVNPLGMGLRAFIVPFRGRDFKVVTGIYQSDRGTWEHISVSLKNRNPNWDEMCHMKNLFWEKEDQCIQFHPRETEYVNLHNHALHIWKPPMHVQNLLDCKV